MDDLIPYLSLLPPEARDLIVAISVAAIALRTFLQGSSGALRAFAGFAAWLDVRFDGAIDWRWPTRLARNLDWFDKEIVARLPFKAPFVKDRR